MTKTIDFMGNTRKDCEILTIRLPKALFFYLTFSLMVGALAWGCVSTPERDPHGAVVVERSKQDAPPWTGLQPDRLVSIGDRFRFMVKRDQIVNLPLGLKQTQIAAMQASRLALQDKVDQIVAKVIPTLALTPTDQSEARSTLRRAVQSVHSDGAKVVDIYFEKLARETPKPEQLASFYRAHILVEFAEGLLEDAVVATASELTQSKRPSLRSLGKALRELPPTAMSH